MSTTITIVNNREWIVENAPYLIQEEKCECVCGIPSSILGRPLKGCPYCSDSGFMTVKVFPYEMNVCERNFWTILDALKLTEFSEVWGTKLLFLLSKTPSSVVCRAQTTSGNVTIGGVDTEQAERYWAKLREIAQEASRREERVTWV